MGFGIRVFLFDNSNIERISHTKFQRLLDGHETEKIIEYAGKKVKYAIAYLRIENRKPTEILHIDYSSCEVNRDGKLNQDILEQQKIDAMKVISIPVDDMPSNVIDEATTFAAKQYQNKYTWTPTDEELNKIYRLIFSP